MMSKYIRGFVKRFFELKLRGLAIACLDTDALSACKAITQESINEGFRKQSNSNSNSGTTPTISASDFSTFLCLDSQQGHIIYNKHRWIPILLSAHVDVIWVDFDIYLFKDPIRHIYENYIWKEYAKPQTISEMIRNKNSN